MIIQNAIKITEDENEIYLKSTHVHDFVSYTLKDGTELFIDGGTEYIRTNISFGRPEVENYTLLEGSPKEDIINKLLWGTYGKEGKIPFHHKPIKDLEKEHIEAILQDYKDSGKLNNNYLEVFEYWLAQKE